MLKIEYLQELLVIAIVLSVITCSFLQKTKRIVPSPKLIPIYSLMNKYVFMGIKEMKVHMFTIAVK